MIQALKLFAEAVSSAPPRSSSSVRVRYLGVQWAPSALRAFSELGWEAASQDRDSRLEFFSVPRESHDGIFLEELPAGFSGDLVQRFFAACFQGLRPKGVLFIGFRDHAPVALLTWLRQAGFQSLQQGESDG
ncbi:hypothetical protein EBZ37_12740, partial [bacterium]|nr:hypothetical protein [bacterium]